MDAYVDGDIIVNKAAWAAEKSTADPLPTFRQYVDWLVSEIGNKYGVAEIFFGLQGKNNFRYDVAQIRPYKGNRAKMKKPANLGAFRNLLEVEYGAEVIHGRETDDWLGTSADPFNDFIVSSDKDLLQIPGKHIRIANGNTLNAMSIGEDEARIYFYRSMLIGDKTDNIIGCPGIGEKKAAAAIHGSTSKIPFQDEREMTKVCYNHYFEWYRNEYDKFHNIQGRGMTAVDYSSRDLAAHEAAEIMLKENAQLLWIQRRDKPVWVDPRI